MNFLRTRVHVGVFFVLLFSLLVEGKLDNLNPRTYRAAILHPKRSVFVLFYTPTCDGCVTALNTFDTLAVKWYNTTKEDFKVAAMDCSKYQEVARYFRIERFPTILLFTPQNKTGRLSYSGETTVEDFEQYLRSYGVNLVEPEQGLDGDL